MPVSLTLLNWRSSCLPTISSYAAINVEPPKDIEGVGPASPVLVREYKGTVQILIEGDTRDVLQAVGTAGSIGGFSTNPPSNFNNVNVDPSNNFAIPNDMNIPSAYTNKVGYTVSEVIGNYSKSEYGKMSATITMDMFTFPQYLDENNNWKFIPAVEVG